MATAAQCGGIDSVVQMFSNRKLEAWSIWIGKQFLFTGIGVDELQTVLEAIQDGTNACYTLKVYKGITDADDIDEKTAAAGSFNFYPKEKQEYDGARSSRTRDTSSGGSIGAIQRVFENEFADYVKDRLAGNNDEPKRKSKLGMLGEILDHPVLGSIFEKLALQYLSADVARVHQLPGHGIPMQAVGNVTTDAQLMQALEKLRQHDPQLTEHLMKLAALAEADNKTFTNLIGAIDLMKL